jgi:hypothetical protein
VWWRGGVVDSSSRALEIFGIVLGPKHVKLPSSKVG